MCPRFFLSARNCGSERTKLFINNSSINQWCWPNQLEVILAQWSRSAHIAVPGRALFQTRQVRQVDVCCTRVLEWCTGTRLLHDDRVRGYCHLRTENLIAGYVWPSALSQHQWQGFFYRMRRAPRTLLSDSTRNETVFQKPWKLVLGAFLEFDWVEKELARIWMSWSFHWGSMQSRPRM